MCMKEYRRCGLCPRKCFVDRTSANRGICGETSQIRIGRAALHHWEEPCISGCRGSGAVFFAGCSLKCCYCQNYALSRGEKGRNITVEELKDIFLNLQQQGAHNINLVTSEHFAPQIKKAVSMAKKEGLFLPIILNSSGYVTQSTIEMLGDMIDIYLVDFKYMDESLAEKYSLAKDYPRVAKKALEKMMELRGELIYDENSMLQSGVIVRHLCLPGCVENSKKVIEYVYTSYGERLKLSIMSQYTPVEKCQNIPQLSRRLTQSEYDRVIDFCLEIGIEDAYIQEGEAASESFIPEFQ